MIIMNYKPLFLFLFITICSCEKNPFDYRTRYIGDYTFSVHFSRSAGVYPNVSWFDTSYISEGRIEYGYDKTTIKINLTSADSWNFPTLYEDGTIDGNGWSGEFVDYSKIKIEHVYFRPSGVSVTTVEGTKK
jgi:hypothetical protein